MWLKPVIADENRIFKGQVSFTLPPHSVDLWPRAGGVVCRQRMLGISCDVAGLKHRRDFFSPHLQRRGNHAPPLMTSYQLGIRQTSPSSLYRTVVQAFVFSLFVPFPILVSLPTKGIERHSLSYV